MRAVRVGICGLLIFAVLAFGAVEEWSQAVVEAGAALLLVLWSLLQFLRKSEQLTIPVELLPLGAFAVVVLAQLVFHLTASSYDTRVGLQLLLTYMIVIFLLAQAFTRTRHYKNLLWFLMSAGFLVSLFAILQFLTFNGKLYWFREIHSRSMAFGPYVNRNHFAGFAELIIPMSLVPLALGKVRRERRLLVALFALVPIVALVLSASRGGIVSFVVEIAVLFLLLRLSQTRRKHVIAAGVVVLIAMMAVSWVGVQQVIQRFSGTQALEVTVGKRAAMRRDTWKMFLDYPVLGTGLGTFQRVFPPYDSAYDGKIVNHAHNDYLEALSEAGILGGLCCFWFLGVVIRNSLQSLADPKSSLEAMLNLSGLVGCCGMLVHSLVDFNLQIPANALLFFISAHLATAQIQPTRKEAQEGVPERIRPRNH